MIGADSLASPTLATALQEANRVLHSALEAELLLAHLLGKPRVYLLTWPERVLTPDELESYRTLVRRRAEGEPIAYITGRREFWSLELAVSPATLIPRADTETLVVEALRHLPPDQPCRVADLGTGSGAIALALASERPHATVVATDLSPAALAVAQENGARLGLTNLRFRTGRWFEPLAGERFQVIASNPPYIPEADRHLGEGDLRFEPRSALASGADGLDDLRQIVRDAPAHLERGGWLLLEHAYDQGAAVRALLQAAGFVSVYTCQDLEQRDRVTAGQRP